MASEKSQTYQKMLALLNKLHGGKAGEQLVDNLRRNKTGQQQRQSFKPPAS